MATWGQRRQHFIELGIGILLLLLVAGGIYFFTYKAPSCTDHTQNQGEAGIDCGGPCANACSVAEVPLEVDFVRALTQQPGRTDVIAYVTNHNTDAGAHGAQADIQLFDENNGLIVDKVVQVNVPPAMTVPVFIPGFYTGTRIPGQIFMTISSTTPTWPRNGQKVVIPVPKTVSIENSATPRVTATLMNPTATELDNLTVVVVVRDAAKNVIGASQTVLKALPGLGTTTVVFTWNQPFPAAPISAEILPVPQS